MIAWTVKMLLSSFRVKQCHHNHHQEEWCPGKMRNPAKGALIRDASGWSGLSSVFQSFWRCPSSLILFCLLALPVSRMPTSFVMGWGVFVDFWWFGWDNSHWNYISKCLGKIHRFVKNGIYDVMWRHQNKKNNPKNKVLDRFSWLIDQVGGVGERIPNPI